MDVAPHKFSCAVQRQCPGCVSDLHRSLRGLLDAPDSLVDNIPVVATLISLTLAVARLMFPELARLDEKAGDKAKTRPDDAAARRIHAGCLPERVSGPALADEIHDHERQHPQTDAPQDEHTEAP